ncbi:response regulator transcription factor [Weissella paramesenteroides]|uniref:response regulator transcription factor n=1 Tax=Weissella paramesenteroides TaxID=1249 RepID=UPI002072D3B9|nr:response regulator transcription factor [Weissella paramesenteroides]MCM6764659.1 response regulator transcription factor [Weissella paramesenteroides]MCM6768231.1 response regulator transcription factor [Weissella paramesenteroides]MCM6768523.1 response regulator transcription factor [Weissella paramesenteroides]MCM6770596.1 response regulator transcription factor [Weissella paramesenteroides]MCM6780519.1 response regulator transcription factor [Weissella paramesenteroides]
MKTKILLVEDEEGLADSLKTELELEDMVVIWAKDGQEALNLFHEYEQELNLIILDWMLPKLDGFSVLRRIRKNSQMPVIMLTARDYIGDKVAGLTGGADDYMTKPFEVEELLARIEVSLRHSQKTDHQAKIYTVGDLTVDTTTKRVSRHDKIIPLTQREYELLVVLVTNEDESCSRDGLLDEVWGVDFEGQPNILDVYVRNLRSKIDADPSNQKLIHTVRGVGYMLSQNVQNR